MKFSASFSSFVFSYNRELSCSILRGFDYRICDSLNIYSSAVKKLGEGELYKHLSRIECPCGKEMRRSLPTGKKNLSIKAVASVRLCILIQDNDRAHKTSLTSTSMFCKRHPGSPKHIGAALNWCLFHLAAHGSRQQYQMSRSAFTTRSAPEDGWANSPFATRKVCLLCGDWQRCHMKYHWVNSIWLNN